MKSKVSKILSTVAIVLVVLIVGFSSFTIIPTGYTGVRTTFGQVEKTTLQNGFNWKVPFVQQIQLVNNKQQDVTYNGQIWSETEERTAIYYDGVTVTFQINPERSAWIYANVSDYKNSLVTQNIVASAIKAASKQLNDADATNRGIIEPLVLNTLQSNLDEKYQPGTIIINKVTISNVDFDESYNQAFAAKQKAQIEAEQQAVENQMTISNVDFDESYNQAIAAKQKAQIEAEQQAVENQMAIDKAQADATVALTEAQAQADAQLIRAQAEAEANRILQESLSPEILQQMYIEKWNGALPMYMGGGENGASLFIDMSQTEAQSAPQTTTAPTTPVITETTEDAE